MSGRMLIGCLAGAMLANTAAAQEAGNGTALQGTALEKGPKRTIELPMDP